MTFQAVKGMRDFYPDAMRLRNWIIDAWRRVSIRNGFEEFDAPMLECLDLFTAKSGPGIVGELFSLTDRGGRQLAIRAEMTPSLARMINAKVNSLPRPIKWFCVPQVCRAENPQRGRGREFFQWNVDVVGEPSVLADAECVLTAVDAMRELGLSAGDVVVRYSSRALLSAILEAFRVTAEAAAGTMAAIDKKPKVPPDVFDKMLAEAMPEPAAQDAVRRYLDLADADTQIAGATAAGVAAKLGMAENPAVAAALADLAEFRKAVAGFGVADWCRFDPRIIRGLAYYTGIVYEIFDAAQSLRAVAGGGRYDNLLEALGGPAVPATGFGMGDIVLGILLEEKGKLPAAMGKPSLDAFVIAEGESDRPAALAAVAVLRRGGLAADFSYKAGAVGKQLKEANRRGARRAIILRGESVGVKDLATGRQTDLPAAAFFADPAGNLSQQAT
jgi:histidyl-tRNA synthetase